MDQPKRQTRRERVRGNKKCPDCKHVKFNDDWGEYKCLKHQHRIQNPDKPTDCKDYEKER